MGLRDLSNMNGGYLRWNADYCAIGGWVGGESRGKIMKGGRGGGNYERVGDDASTSRGQKRNFEKEFPSCVQYISHSRDIRISCASSVLVPRIFPTTRMSSALS